MNKQDPFRNSELDRARTKRHFFHSLISDKRKRHRSDTGLVEDRTSSVTIVRIIVGLLMIHLIIIGGVLLRGQMVRESTGIAAPASIAPPPSPIVAQQPSADPAQGALPQPLVTPAPTHTTAQTATPADHITQATSAGHISQAPATDDDTAEEAEDEPVIIAPTVVTSVATAPVAAEPMRHLVAPGDTWYRIAGQYGTTEAALKAANPSQAQGILRAGATLTIPASAKAAQARQATRSASTATATASTSATTGAGEKIHIVKRGETLSGIASKAHISLQELIKINNIQDAKRIYPGMKLRLSR